ncbi:hypothetical protein POSPLADRAFT_1160005 [Postia placenta MAD-698-R-SB12]|uniref:Fungal N-terminal domain-containing protein n=1 Tax=Postia placenta MAD-698-R-SB12 TaxID=670580 RepID=A0A1X6MJE9_9APHY|nr:hypothetical protein POSPLADRAFT_1160005 [Postia placenta MAD-698-R-SB12]OSX56500.1 hypothetical protein POSPLADRAFT_1160005 [Postia placenta MAD-698-R-SB12]
MPVVTLGTVTDIIELARVLKDLYTALDEIRGSTAEYQDVAADLRRFSVHMQAVEEVIASFPETASPHAVALKQDIKGWTELARKWQLKFGKYEKTLGTEKGKILSKRTYHKVVWYLRGRPRVAKFRTELEAAQGGALLQFMAIIGFVQRGDYIMSLVLTRDQGDELERIIRPPQWTLTVTDGAEFTMTIAMNVPTGDVCPRRPGNEPLPQPPEVEQESLNDVLKFFRRLHINVIGDGSEHEGTSECEGVIEQEGATEHEDATVHEDAIVHEDATVHEGVIEHEDTTEPEGATEPDINDDRPTVSVYRSPDIWPDLINRANGTRTLIDADNSITTNPRQSEGNRPQLALPSALRGRKALAGLLLGPGQAQAWLGLSPGPDHGGSTQSPSRRLREVEGLSEYQMTYIPAVPRATPRPQFCDIRSNPGPRSHPNSTICSLPPSPGGGGPIPAVPRATPQPQFCDIRSNLRPPSNSTTLLSSTSLVQNICEQPASEESLLVRGSGLFVGY